MEGLALSLHYLGQAGYSSEKNGACLPSPT